MLATGAHNGSATTRSRAKHRIKKLALPPSMVSGPTKTRIADVAWFKMRWCDGSTSAMTPWSRRGSPVFSVFQSSQPTASVAKANYVETPRTLRSTERPRSVFSLIATGPEAIRAAVRREPGSIMRWMRSFVEPSCLFVPFVVQMR